MASSFRLRLRLWGTIAAFALISSDVLADAPTTAFSKPELICDQVGASDYRLSPPKLVDQMISQHQLLSVYERAIRIRSQSHPGETAISSLDAVRRDLVLNRGFCQAYGGACSGKDDVDNVRYMQANVTSMVTNHQGLSRAASGTKNVILDLPAGSNAANYERATTGDYLYSPDRFPLRCIQSGAPVWQQNVQTGFGNVLRAVRLRATADQLMIPPAPSFISGPDPSHSGNDLYLANNNAKFGINQASGSSGVSTSLVGVLGVPIPVGTGLLGPLNNITILPYVGIDRENKTTTSNRVTTTKFSANTYDVGIAFSADTGLPFGDLNDLWFGIRPDWLKNDMDGSSIFSVNTKATPLTAGWPPINQLHPLFGKDPIVEWMLQLDLRANFGHFTAKGHPTDPRLNHDFVRLGGLIGPQVEINLLPDNPIDLSATYTDFYAAEGFNKSLGLFEAALTFNFDPKKIFQLSLQYANGRRDDTGQRLTMWSASLGLKF